MDIIVGLYAIFKDFGKENVQEDLHTNTKKVSGEYGTMMTRIIIYKSFNM